MADHSRLLLCVFMFAVVAFNPFGNLLSNNNISYSQSSWTETVMGDGRTILNTKSGTRLIKSSKLIIY